MSEVNTEQGGQEKGKHKKVRAKKSSTHVDMTPMVDLAFLLLTFFMLTTTFSKPKTMELNMPKNDKDKPNEINNGMTVLLTGDNKVFYYFGAFKPDTTQFTASSFDMDNGIHQVLLEKNRPVVDDIIKLAERKEKKEIPDSVYKKMKKEVQGNSKALTVLIKTDDKAKYRNAIDLIDELNSCMVGKYAMVAMEAKEYEMLQKLTAK